MRRWQADTNEGINNVMPNNRTTWRIYISGISHTWRRKIGIYIQKTAESERNVALCILTRGNDELV